MVFETNSINRGVLYRDDLEGYYDILANLPGLTAGPRIECGDYEVDRIYELATPDIPAASVDIVVHGGSHKDMLLIHLVIGRRRPSAWMHFRTGDSEDWQAAVDLLREDLEATQNTLARIRNRKYLLPLLFLIFIMTVSIWAAASEAGYSWSWVPAVATFGLWGIQLALMLSPRGSPRIHLGRDRPTSGQRDGHSKKPEWWRLDWASWTRDAKFTLVVTLLLGAASIWASWYFSRG